MTYAYCNGDCGLGVSLPTPNYISCNRDQKRQTEFYNWAASFLQRLYEVKCSGRWTERRRQFCNLCTHI